MIHGKIEVKSHKREVDNELAQKITKALKQIGLTAESGAKQLCPVDTGNLRNSISHQVQEKTVYIGTAVEYGKYVEFDDNAKHKNGQAHFLRDTIEGQFGEYKLIVQNELKD